MEEIHQEYARRLKGYELKVHDRFEVRVFARQEHYEAALPGTLVGSAGAFISMDRLLAAYKGDRPDEQVFRTLYHEGFHQFMYSCIAKDPPLWVNEGLAEYFSEATWNGRSFTTGQVPVMKLHSVQQALRNGTAIPLPQLLARDSQTWLHSVRQGNTAGALQYDQAWSLIHFLVHSHGGRHRPKLLDYLRRVSDGADRREAFRASFGTRIAGFEQSWRRYVLSLRPSPDARCRKNLRLLAHLALMVYGSPADFRSLGHLRRRLLDDRYRWYVEAPDGERIASGDKARVRSLFRCPMDRNRSEVSYLAIMDPRTGLPALVCTHQRGVVTVARYLRKPGGEYRVEVDQQVTATLSEGMVRALRSAGVALGARR
jgi:hypothetical protein